MDPEDVINLFDSCWFNYEILKKDQSSKANQSLSSSEPKFSSLRSILVRSKSDDIGSFNYGSFSPNSVLFTSHLDSIPSGNLDSTVQKQEQVQEDETKTITVRETVNTDQKEQSVQEMKKRKKKRHGFSKSLSDLEFEELKGFMDLGFIFSEEDKDSKLVEIIPGLQRLGVERGNDDKGSCSSSSARRPYLSEAWENMDRRLQTPLLNWEIPVVRDEIDMKDNLKLWAHTVASYVR
ncbi:uncharacterized protein LOC111910026 [Lactuca sativa]|uniref:DUF1685 domain-containing protein n=1 Tax=Lactuca sativa TaxID=4236 RepID=A0A9R1XU08_LACSA|nr:uncharacterized protein LOC111910026 [Lactuca sativa]KAJ0227455.1 hypothetical protein LSAT_V11C100043530 [Lactuca sativa]